MRTWKALALAAALGGTSLAFGQDTTTDPFAALGVFGPIAAIIVIYYWIRWGGLKLLF